MKPDVSKLNIMRLVDAIKVLPIPESVIIAALDDLKDVVERSVSNDDILYEQSQLSIKFICSHGFVWTITKNGYHFWAKIYELL